jgi:hypothetical protein
VDSWIALPALLLILGACDGPRAKAVAIPAASSLPYVPQDVPEDRPPPLPDGGPTVADADFAEIDRSLDTVRYRIDALPRTDAGVPLSSSTHTCLENLRAQIETARRSANDRRAAIRAASERDDSERVKHDRTIVRVLADRADQLAAEANNCR